MKASQPYAYARARAEELDGEIMTHINIIKHNDAITTSDNNNNDIIIVIIVIIDIDIMILVTTSSDWKLIASVIIIICARTEELDGEMQTT